MLRVAIVIPTWNKAGLLAQALQSLRTQTHPVDRVIVVDNGSTDDSATVAASEGAHVIALGKNTGFAAAVNRGIREAAGSEFICVLNNDVTLAPDWLELLIQKLETVGAWFATGKLLDARERQRIDGSFDAVCRGGGARARTSRRNRPGIVEPTQKHTVSCIHGRRVPGRSVRSGGALGRKIRILPRRRRFWFALRRSGAKRGLRPASGRLSPGQCYARAMAPRHGAEDRAKPVIAGGETLSAELGLTLWLASIYRTNFMGIRRAQTRC